MISLVTAMPQPALPTARATPPSKAERADGAARDAVRRADDRVELSAEANAPRPGSEDLSPEQVREVEELKARDLEVRQHEQAHVAAAGDLFRGGPFYEYKTGPDGNRYAVAGSVRIDTSEGQTPEETMRRAATIRRSALAPKEPSSTDRRVAAKADRMAREAQAEIASRDETSEGTQNDGRQGASAAGRAALEAYGDGAESPSRSVSRSGSRSLSRSGAGGVSVDAFA
ncbi:MAG: putative metalloprotease CJM1_0395 family protein [Planctomycetota bacterium]